LRFLKSNPNRQDALNNLGVALRQSGQFAAAETCYRRLLALSGPTSGLCVNLGNCLRDQGTPVWVAPSVFHDWRYRISGDLTPWYESARVFKQTRPGEWSDVIPRMITSLRQFTG